MLLSSVCVVGFQYADTAPVDEDLLEDRILLVTCGKERLWWGFCGWWTCFVGDT